jgi:hypothetical protein
MGVYAEIRKADRSRASGPPVPGEGMEPERPGRRRIRDADDGRTNSLGRRTRRKVKHSIYKE